MIFEFDNNKYFDNNNYDNDITESDIILICKKSNQFFFFGFLANSQGNP